MSDKYHCSESEWLAVCERITAGHIPMGPGKYGGKQATYWEGIGVPSLFRIPPKSGDVCFDFACGNGRLAIGLLQYDVSYIGVDPLRASIDFCREAFAPWPRFRFERLPVKTGWTPEDTIEPLDMRIPLPDCSVDWAAALSLFTHLGTLDVAEHYAREMLRILKPGGTCWTTWFKSPPNAPTSDLGRTVFLATDIRAMLDRCGMEWVCDEGCTDPTWQHDQWRVWGRKR